MLEDYACSYKVSMAYFMQALMFWRFAHCAYNLLLLSAYTKEIWLVVRLDTMHKWVDLLRKGSL